MLHHEHGLLGNESACNAYNEVVRFAIDTLEDELKEYAESPLERPRFLGLVAALSRLASGPQKGPYFESVMSDRLGQLRAMYEDWWGKFGKKVKIDSLASREAVHEEAMLEWDYMLHLYAGFKYPEPQRLPLSVTMDHGGLRAEYHQRKADRAARKKSTSTKKKAPPKKKK
ncbi:MAG: hypothetical protein KDA69_18035 [Planctomycetaceae bacterium]|nr:hypothetical protein [Planctomycetaceae bacterium]MCA9046234.1 hypothetical protein [Planctomycetaceae bacterium]MCB9950779.1 hypothetical protein [Planctomycetaceae bacterium]